jgi:hypothetical protein
MCGLEGLHGGRKVEKAGLGAEPGMARRVYVSAPPASGMTVTGGQRAQVKRA